MQELHWFPVILSSLRVKYDRVMLLSLGRGWMLIDHGCILALRVVFLCLNVMSRFSLQASVI